MKKRYYICIVALSLIMTSLSPFYTLYSLTYNSLENINLALAHTSYYLIEHNQPEYEYSYNFVQNEYIQNYEQKNLSTTEAILNYEELIYPAHDITIQFSENIASFSFGSFPFSVGMALPIQVHNEQELLAALQLSLGYTLQIKLMNNIYLQNTLAIHNYNSPVIISGGALLQYASSETYAPFFAIHNGGYLILNGTMLKFNNHEIITENAIFQNISNLSEYEYALYGAVIILPYNAKEPQDIESFQDKQAQYEQNEDKDDTENYEFYNNSEDGKNESSTNNSEDGESAEPITMQNTGNPQQYENLSPTFSIQDALQNPQTGDYFSFFGLTVSSIGLFINGIALLLIIKHIKKQKKLEKTYVI